jgi:tRNA-Thr(GGU) m(6)t(6)A37 methyltransferase TsaA
LEETNLFKLEPIGWVRSAWSQTGEAPHQGPEEGAESLIEVNLRWAEGLRGLKPGRDLWVICYLHQTRGPKVMVHPKGDRSRPLTGMFNTRSPHRPSPLSLTLVRLLAKEGTRLTVRGLDMIDGTPVLDIKPYVADVDQPRG